MRLHKGHIIILIGAVAVLTLQGCTTLNFPKAIEAGNPIPQWEKALVKYYTAVDTTGPEAQKPPKLKFIADYEAKYPQLNGEPEYRCQDEKRATFSNLSIKDYAAYRRDRTVCDLQMQQEDIKVEKETLRLAALEAQLELQNAKVTLFENAGKKSGDDYDRAKDELAEIKNSLSAADTAIKEAKIRAIDIQIERLKGLGAKATKPGEESKENHLEAAGILELAKQDRNRMLGELMVVARRVHDMKDHSLHYTRASINTFFDFTQIISTSVAAVAGSEGTARALAAAATGSAAAQESFDVRFFYQHATTAVIAIMKKQRHEAEQVLVMNMSKDVLEYPLRVALADYAAFLLAGSLTDALAELGADAKVKELRELQNLNTLKNMSEEHLKELRKQQESAAAENAARKERQKQYVNLVDQALFGRIDALLNPAGDASSGKTDDNKDQGK